MSRPATLSSGESLPQSRSHYHRTTRQRPNPRYFLRCYSRRRIPSAACRKDGGVRMEALPWQPSTFISADQRRKPDLCQVLTTKLRILPKLIGPPRMCPNWGCELQ